MQAANVAYVVSDIYEPPNVAGYTFQVTNPATGTIVPVSWNRRDEEKLDTENKKVNFVYTLFKNAIDCVKFIDSERAKEDEVEEVDFSE